MKYEEMVKLFRREPFVPFRVVAVDGRAYDVTWAGGALVTPRRISFPRSSDGGWPDQLEDVEWSDIARVETLAESSRSWPGCYNAGMKPQELHGMLRREPFVPFRVVASDGRAYEVTWAGGAMVTPRRISFPCGDDGGWPDHLEHIQLRDIARVETLAESSHGEPR